MFDSQMGHYLVHGGERLAAGLTRARPVHPQAPEVPGGFYIPEKRTRLVNVVAVVALERLVPFGRSSGMVERMRLVMHGLGVMEAKDLRRGRRRRELLVVPSQQEISGGVSRVVVQMARVMVPLATLVEVVLRWLLHPWTHNLARVGWRRAHLQP